MTPNTNEKYDQAELDETQLVDLVDVLPPAIRAVR
jgi:hypothetical protein